MPSRRDFLLGAAALAAAGGAAAISLNTGSDGSVLWSFNAPVLNQGQVGSCTGNAVTQFLNTDYATGISKRTSYLTEADALKIYTAATEYDDPEIPGDYPNVDTGSTGNFACVGALELGYLSGFEDVDATIPAIFAALKKQPLIVGSNWTTGMFTPDAGGFVTPTGGVAGGHEYLMLGFNVTGKYFTFLNSWSDTWGLKGRFKAKSDDYVKLLGGDNAAVVAPTPKHA